MPEGRVAVGGKTLHYPVVGAHGRVDRDLALEIDMHFLCKSMIVVTTCRDYHLLSAHRIIDPLDQSI